MGEIINVQVGQCGNQVGQEFWRTIRREHNVDELGVYTGKCKDHDFDHSAVFFQEGAGGRYLPRSVMVDLEPGVLDAIRSSDQGKLFSPDNFVYGQNGAGNNWAKGHYTEGAELMEEAMDVIRKQTEACSSLQGFQIVHSIGGGTGSGMGTLLLNKVREHFPDRTICTYSVIPSPKVSTCIVEPYNALLSMNQLIECADETFVLDNEALYDICMRNLKLKDVHYSNLNSLVASVMSGVTCGLRFPGQLNNNLRKLAVNLIPFPRLHFFMCSHAPLTSVASRHYQRSSVGEIAQQLFDPRTLMTACDPRNGRYLAGSVSFRGANIKSQEVESTVDRLHRSMGDMFVDWIPNNLKTSVCNVAAPGTELSGTFIANSTAIQDTFKRLADQYSAMFRRKAFLYSYFNEGMDEMEFQEAEGNVTDLIAEYEQYTVVTADDFDDQWEDDDEFDNPALQDECEELLESVLELDA